MEAGTCRLDESPRLKGTNRRRLSGNPEMRVITWNMGMAGPKRRRPGLHDQAWHYLLGLGPDLAFLQEALPPAWVRGEGSLVCGPITQWGSVVFSPRYPLTPFPLSQESRLRRLGAYLSFATAPLPDGSDRLVGSIHAPARDATAQLLEGLDAQLIARPSVGRPRVNDVVFACLEELVRQESSFLLAGDWNTGRTQGSEQASRAGREFFERVEQAGWFECLPADGSEVRTWFREGDRLLQDDHAFCDKALRDLLGKVSVASDAATLLRLSDHAPLILDFDVEPISRDLWSSADKS